MFGVLQGAETKLLLSLAGDLRGDIGTPPAWLTRTPYAEAWKPCLITRWRDRAVAIGYEPAHWKAEGGGGDLVPLEDRPLAQLGRLDGSVLVALDRPSARRVCLEAQSLQQGRPATDLDELIRAVKISWAEPAPVRALLAQPSIHGRVIEALHGNAPFPSSIELDTACAVWRARVTDRVDAACVARVLETLDLLAGASS